MPATFSRRGEDPNLQGIPYEPNRVLLRKLRRLWTMSMIVGTKLHFVGKVKE
jgi:hypothetical protein